MTTPDPTARTRELAADPDEILRPFLDACIQAIGRIGIGRPDDPGDELVDVTVRARDVRRAFAYGMRVPRRAAPGPAPKETP